MYLKERMGDSPLLVIILKKIFWRGGIFLGAIYLRFVGVPFPQDSNKPSHILLEASLIRRTISDQRLARSLFMPTFRKINKRCLEIDSLIDSYNFIPDIELG